MYNQHRIVIVFVAFMEDGRMVIRKIKLIIKLYFQVSGIECCVVFSINYHHRLDIKYSAANNIYGSSCSFAGHLHIIFMI